MTRDQWAQIWESIKMIEQLNQFDNSPRAKRIQKEVEYMKKLVQGEIGQME